MKIFLLLATLLFSFAANAGTATATFAGGCFWCMEADFEKLPGVSAAVSGYTGGKELNPTYEQVSDHLTGHTESVLVTYDPARLSYDQLLDYYWRHVDPFTANAQFCDHGPQYRTAIFYTGEAEKQAALASRETLGKSGKFTKPIVTEIVPAGTFYPAEEYHQDYYRKNPLRYRYYRSGCGRDDRLKELWGPDASTH
jgi:peptide-methionine (S)-S-oxide reductase